MSLLGDLLDDADNLVGDVVDTPDAPVDDIVDDVIDLLDSGLGQSDDITGLLDGGLNESANIVDDVTDLLDGGLDELNDITNGIEDGLPSIGDNTENLIDTIDDVLDDTDIPPVNFEDDDPAENITETIVYFLNTTNSPSTDPESFPVDDNHFGEISTLHMLYSFDIANDKVIAIYEHRDGVDQALSFDFNSVNFIVDPDIVLGKNTDFGMEITRYEDKNNDGLFVRSYEQSVVSSNAQGVKPHFTEILRFSPTTGDDFISVRANEYSLGASGNDTWIIKSLGDLVIGDIEAGEKINIDLGLGLQNLEQVKSHVTSAQYVDDDFVATFGEHASVTLVDVNPDLLSWDMVQVWS